MKIVHGSKFKVVKHSQSAQVGEWLLIAGKVDEEAPWLGSCSLSAIALF